MAWKQATRSAAAEARLKLNARCVRGDLSYEAIVARNIMPPSTRCLKA